MLRRQLVKQLLNSKQQLQIKFCTQNSTFNDHRVYFNSQQLFNVLIQGTRRKMFGVMWTGVSSGLIMNEYMWTGGIAMLLATAEFMVSRVVNNNAHLVCYKMLLNQQQTQVIFYTFKPLNMFSQHPVIKETDHNKYREYLDNLPADMHNELVVDIDKVEILQSLPVPLRKGEEDKGFSVNSLEVTDVNGYRHQVKLFVGPSKVIEIPSLDLLKAIIKGDAQQVEQFIFQQQQQESFYQHQVQEILDIDMQENQQMQDQIKQKMMQNKKNEQDDVKNKENDKQEKNDK